MLARLRAPEGLFGAAVAGLGVFVLVAGREIESPVPWGPGLMPQIVGAGLVVLGLATLIELARSPVAAGGGEGESESDWPGFALVLAGLVAFAALIGVAGFPAAAAAMFALVARGQGSRRPARDFMVGFGLAVAAYAVFAVFLGLPLSWGGALQTALEAR